jgi:UDP-N-acetylglucosamine 2-epimerase (non-hydrolysing)
VKYNKSSLFFFGATALTSFVSNILLVRNLQGDDLKSWVLAGTLAGIISVLVSGTTLKEISAQQKDGSGSSPTVTIERENSGFRSRTLIIGVICIGVASFINFFLAYLLAFAFLSIKNARIAAFLQIKGLQKELLINTWIMFLSFLSFLIILRAVNSLNFIFVSSSHLICLAISLKILEKRVHPKIHFGKPISRQNFLFAFFYFGMNNDLFLARQKLFGDAFTTYSAASSFTRFSIALVSLYSLFYLSNFTEKNDTIDKRTWVRHFSIVITLGFLGFSLTQLDISLPEQILGKRFQDFLLILVLQVAAIIPWLFAYFYTQFCIIKMRKHLATILALVCLFESFFVLSFIESFVFVSLAHFFFGCILMYSLFKLSSMKKQEMRAREYYFILGTSAEMIKVKYLVSLFPCPTVLNTKQHDLSIRDVLTHIETPFVKEVNIGSRLLSYLGRLSDTPLWLVSRIFGLTLYFAKLKFVNLRNPKEVFIFIHGDTLSSGLGALVGRLFYFEVAHVEAGLRSRNLFNPFPEEITRRMNSVLANIHFAPGENYLSNLKNCSGLKFSTGGNTFLDTLDMKSLHLKTSLDRQDPYVVIHLHRLELLQNKRLLNQTLQEVASLSEQFALYVIDENHFRLSFDNLDSFGQHERFTFLPKMSRADFLALCLNSEFVLSDSGGTQEELAFLGVPMLIHRKYTERFDGLGINAVLSKWETGSILKFSENYQNMRKETLKVTTSPSRLIHEIVLSISNVRT